MNQIRISEKERTNKTIMICHWVCVIVAICFATYRHVSGTVEYIKFVPEVILGFGPVIAEVYFWKKDHETGMIRHLVAIGYAVFFSFELLTTDNNLIMILVIPMILAISVCNDEKLCIQINTGTVALALIQSFLGAKFGMCGYDGAYDNVILTVTMINVAIISFYTAKISRKNAEDKLEEANEAKRNAEETLTNLQFVTQGVHDSVKYLYENLDKLKKAFDSTSDSMTQLSEGALETANAVQTQTMQTEEIQAKVDTVSDNSNQINMNMQQTLEVLKKGDADVELLVAQVEHSVENGDLMTKKLETLDEYVEEMHSIVKIISSIANQTSMLALNASIEAARAGEAGRGFAVVATQVTNMAAQTKDATANITEVIENVSSAVSEVVTVIKQMLEGVREEKQSTQNTADSFKHIKENTLQTRDRVEILTASIAELRTANEHIMESIQTISAISQEVSAHANDTEQAEKENLEILDQIDRKMADLIQYIQKKS